MWPGWHHIARVHSPVAGEVGGWRKNQMGARRREVNMKEWGLALILNKTRCEYDATVLFVASRRCRYC